MLNNPEFKIDFSEKDFIESKSHEIICSEESDRLLYYFFTEPDDMLTTTKFYSVDCSTLESSKARFIELKEVLIQDGDVNQKFGWVGKNQILISTPQTSLIADLEKNEILSVFNHQLKINFKENQFCFLDNILAWSSSKGIHVARLLNRPESSEAMIEKIKEVKIEELFKEVGFECSKKPPNFSLFKEDDGNFTIFLFKKKVVFFNKRETHFVRISIDPQTLEIKQVYNNPVDSKFFTTDQKVQIHKTEGFLVFSAYGREGSKMFSSVNLASLDFKILDRFFYKQEGEIQPPSQIIRIKNDQVISTQATVNLFKDSNQKCYLHEIDKIEKKLILKKVLKMSYPGMGSTFQADGLGGFCDDLLNSSKQPMTIFKFSDDLSNFESFKTHDIGLVRAFVYLESGKYIFENKKLLEETTVSDEFEYLESDGAHPRCLFELDFEARSVRPFRCESFQLAEQALTRNGLRSFLYECHADWLVLSDLQR